MSILSCYLAASDIFTIIPTTNPTRYRFLLPLHANNRAEISPFRLQALPDLIIVQVARSKYVLYSVDLYAIAYTVLVLSYFCALADTKLGLADLFLSELV